MLEDQQGGWCGWGEKDKRHPGGRWCCLAHRGTSLFSLSKEEAAEGLSQGLTCFDICLGGIVWATTWRRPWRWKPSQAAAVTRVREDLCVGLVSEAAGGRSLD